MTAASALAARLPSVLPLLSLAALTVCLKLPTLTTPAYWDEMGWTSQAHWLSQQNLLRALPGLRPASMFWGHPPGLHLTLAVLWKVVEPSMWGAHLLIAGFAALGVCGTFLLARLLHDTRTAWFAALLLLSGYSFAMLYFLPRYILPVLPFFYIRAAAALTGLVKASVMKTAVGIGMVGLMEWSLVMQAFGGNGEHNLTYRDAVRLQKAMIDYVASEFPQARTLTVWPHTSQLRSVVLGYTRRPLLTKRFSAEADLADSDLVRVSMPEAGRMSELRALAQANGWRRIRRLEKGSILVKLYGR